jgi:hypothetical protein
MDMRPIPLPDLQTATASVKRREAGSKITDMFAKTDQCVGDLTEAFADVLSAVENIESVDLDASELEEQTDDLVEPMDISQEEKSLKDGTQFFGSLFLELQRRLENQKPLQDIADDGVMNPAVSARVFDFAAEKQKHLEAFAGKPGDTDEPLQAQQREGLDQRVASPGPDYSTEASPQMSPPAIELDADEPQTADRAIVPRAESPLPQALDVPPSTASSAIMRDTINSIVEGVSRLMPTAANPLTVVKTGNAQSLRLNLHPVELGSVDVSIARRGNILRVTLIPALDDTRRLLREDAEKLLQSLGFAHADVAHIEVRIEAPPQPTPEPSGAQPVKTQGQQDAASTFLHDRERQNEHERRTQPNAAPRGMPEGEVVPTDIPHHRSAHAVYL